jgi:hypothetical protein
MIDKALERKALDSAADEPEQKHIKKGLILGEFLPELNLIF